MIHAIPLYLYVDCSEAQAKVYKDKLDELLRNPLLKTFLDPQIPNRGFTVNEPIAMPAAK